MIKRLIFDVDNTLTRNVDLVKITEKTLKEINLYTDENVQRFINGMSTYENYYDNYNYKDYTNHLEKTLGTKLPLNFIDIYFKNLDYAIPEYNPKLVNCIKSLSEKYELVLLTNYFGNLQLRRLNNMKIGKYFKEYYGEKLIKPNKEAFLNACGGYKPNECVMIGDNLYIDILPAKRLGLNTILVNTHKINNIKNIKIVVDKVEDINISLIEKIE